MYDSTCKFIASQYSRELAIWLLGKLLDLTEVKPSELFEVIRLWEMPTEPLLRSPGMFPLAILAQTENRDNLLRQIPQEIEKIGDSRQQSNVA